MHCIKADAEHPQRGLTSEYPEDSPRAVYSVPGNHRNIGRNEAPLARRYDMQKEALWGYQELCQFLGIRPGTAYSWVCRGTVPFIRFSNRCVRFDPTAIHAWVEAKTKQVRAHSDERGATRPRPGFEATERKHRKSPVPTNSEGENSPSGASE